MKTFKQFLAEGGPYQTARGKGVTRDEAKDLLKQIVRALRPEMSDKISEYQDDWHIMIRDYEYFTPRPGEEDDDWPDFTGGKLLLKRLKPIMKGLLWNFSPEEKSWITIYVKKKPLTKAQQRLDKKKRTDAVLLKVQAKSGFADDDWWRRMYDKMIPMLKKHKKKFITKEEFWKYAQATGNFFDSDAAEDVWSDVK